MRHFVIKELEPRSPADGVEMRVVHGEKMTIVYFSLAPGAEMPEHSHPHEQMGTVLAGKIEIVVDGEKKIIDQGSVYHVPSNAVHSGRCLELPSEAIEVFSPPREDFK